MTSSTTHPTNLEEYYMAAVAPEEMHPPLEMDTISPAGERALQMRYDTLQQHMERQHTELQRLMESQRRIEEAQRKALVCVFFFYTGSID